MDFAEFLVPVNMDLRCKEFSQFQIGHKIQFELNQKLDENSIVIIATNEMHHNNAHSTEDWTLDGIREHLYHLSASNWSHKIYDLGTINRGSIFEDSCFALHQIVREITKSGANIILLGGTQALNFILYQALQKDLMKVGTIDIKLDLDASQEELNDQNHITKMILDENYRLLEYVNIGSQIPYVAKEELDILEQLNFEDLRLGKLLKEFAKAEPLLRELNLLSVDMNSMQYASFPDCTIATSNGLNEREICGLMNYAGLSKSLKLLHISNFINSSIQGNNLLAEMLWYFIDAKNNQKLDGELTTYHVQSKEGEIIFLHAALSERWWIQVENDGLKTRIPCNESDYLEAMQGDIPNRWLNFYKKFY